MNLTTQIVKGVRCPFAGTISCPLAVPAYSCAEGSRQTFLEAGDLRNLPLTELRGVDEERAHRDVRMLHPPTGWDKQPDLIWLKARPACVPTHHRRVHRFPILNWSPPWRVSRHITPCTQFHNPLIIPSRCRRNLENVCSMGREKALPFLPRALHPENAYSSPGTKLMFLRNPVVHILPRVEKAQEQATYLRNLGKR